MMKKFILSEFIVSGVGPKACPVEAEEQEV
jgi:hypothetical protein